MQEKQNTYFADTKPHYRLLDGLRGVAALMVVWYHVFEGFGFAGAVNGISDGSITTFNHGYLAVDFFFMLSGFVISYAYYSRWHTSNSSGLTASTTSRSTAPGDLTLAGFFMRRLIRLHPMVIMGAIIGAISFCIGGCTNWMGETISWQNIALALALGMLLIPAWPGARFDVRGNGEMYPLNGPSWSLFFEYIGNILYALVIRKLSTKPLKLLTAALGLCYAAFAITNTSGYGNIGVGWTLDHINFPGGLIRMLFPFTMGTTLHRVLFVKNEKKPCRIIEYLGSLPANLIFACCTITLFAIFSVPFLGVSEKFCANGIFEFICVAVIFPAIVLAAASRSNSSGKGKTINFLGELSYPLYIIHYPVMYLFYSWLIKEKIYSIGECWPIVCGVMLINIAIAYLCLKLYDQPLRKRAARRLIITNHSKNHF